MNFGMDTDSLLCMLKLKMLMKTLLMMLKKGLTHQIIKLKDHWQIVKVKK